MTKEKKISMFPSGKEKKRTMKRTREEATTIGRGIAVNWEGERRPEAVAERKTFAMGVQGKKGQQVKSQRGEGVFNTTKKLLQGTIVIGGGGNAA